jgi:hypothetical protein
VCNPNKEEGKARDELNSTLCFYGFFSRVLCLQSCAVLFLEALSVRRILLQVPVQQFSV